MIPKMLQVRQPTRGDKVHSVDAVTTMAMEHLALAGLLKDVAGKTVAITAGSRGIANYPIILSAIVRYLRCFGAKPFLFPSMGSHGGATASGQVAILESLGVTSESVGCEIRSSMETVRLGLSSALVDTHVDRCAHEADHLFVVNRVKPHTSFFGRHGSGLMKMMAVGMGKLDGATAAHRASAPFDAIADAAFDLFMRKMPGRLLGGVAIVENSDDETGRIESVQPWLFPKRDAELQAVASSWMPRLPVDDIDLLIVDKMGKDVSGTGMDPNVIGRKFSEHKASEGETPRVRLILARGLTEATKGNAVGMGYAEMCTDRLLSQVDRAATLANCMASGFPAKASSPIGFPTDKEAIEAALSILPGSPGVVRIADTLHLRDVQVSESLADSLHPGCLVSPEAFEMAFDARGDL